MKIVIYETIHLDLIIPYAEILADENITVSFITSSIFKNDLKNILTSENPRYTWHFIDPEVRFFEFFKKIRAFFKNYHCDLLILNSIDSRHIIMFMILLLSKPGKILLNLHDINNYFKIRRSLDIRINVRSIGKKLLLLLTDGYIVNAKAMKAYMLKNSFTRKPIYYLQHVYYKPPLPVKITNLNTIVVPGSIDQRRRNYDLVLQAAEELMNRQVPVKWVLAGKPVEDYGAKIIKGAEKLNTRGASISFFKEDIPENEFQNILASSTFILSPLVPLTTVHDNILEVYGQSKASGNVNDTIRHAKPFIVPSTFTVPDEIESSCIIYKSKDNLVEQLLKVLTDKSVFNSYKQKAEENSKKFPKEKIKNMFKEVFMQQLP
jgi:hypothetical protein